MLKVIRLRGFKDVEDRAAQMDQRVTPDDGGTHAETDHKPEKRIARRLVDGSKQQEERGRWLKTIILKGEASP